jgi:hypothetical protein
MNGITIRGSGNISINDAHIQAHGGNINNGPSALKVKIMIPLHTTLDFQETTGDISVGDTHGQVNIQCVGDSKVKLGDIASLQASIQGSAKLIAQKITGSMSATVQGSGRVVVFGKASSASLQVQGSGSIEIDHVDQRPMF